MILPTPTPGPERTTRCRLAPPHWNRRAEPADRWDGGYQHTAYFLDYLEGRCGDGTVRRLNERLREHKYDAKTYWPGVCGEKVEKLWQDYCDKLKDEEAVLVNKDDISDDGVREGDACG